MEENPTPVETVALYTQETGKVTGILAVKFDKRIRSFVSGVTYSLLSELSREELEFFLDIRDTGIIWSTRETIPVVAIRNAILILKMRIEHCRPGLEWDEMTKEDIVEGSHFERIWSEIEVLFSDEELEVLRKPLPKRFPKGQKPTIFRQPFNPITWAIMNKLVTILEKSLNRESKIESVSYLLV